MNEDLTDNPNQALPARGIYLLPNLFTTAALFGGFYAIVASVRGDFEYAASAIFISMVMDTLDGRVARLTGTQSDFGAQYDSLSDMVSFGLAPALLIYKWALEGFGKLGWLAAFVYSVATALRLARFNIQIETIDKRFFRGLPCPAAAAVLAGLVWASTEYALTGRTFGLLLASLCVMLGLLMVSNVPYYSFKDIDFKGKVPFMAALLVVLAFTLVASDPPIVLFGAFVLYAFSGPLYGLRRRWHKRDVKSTEQ